MRQGQREIDVPRNDVVKIEELLAALEVLTAANEMLCCRDATLVTADSTFEFVLDQLYQQNTAFSLKFAESLEKRIEERRDANLTGLLKYLEDPAVFSRKVTHKVLKIPAKISELK